MMWVDDRWLFWAGAALYALAFLAALGSLRGQGRYWRTLMLTLLGGGFVYQSFALFLRGLINHAFPLTNIFEILQVLAWSAIALDLVLRPLFRLRLLNFFSTGLAALLGVISLWVVGWDKPPPELPLAGSPWVGFHVALAVFSYAVFAVLAITSLMYIIQHVGLEARRSGGIFERLPAIRQIEAINGRLIVLGVAVLSVSVAVGVLNWLIEPGTVGLLKLLVAMAVWVSYTTVLVLRKLNRLVAAPFAIACVALFAGTLLSLWPLTAKASLAIEGETPPRFEDVGE